MNPAAPRTARRAATVTQLRAQHVAAKAVSGRRPARRVKVTPQIPPKAIARSYLGALLAVVRDARAAVKKNLEADYHALAVRAASGQSVAAEVAARVERARAEWARTWTPARLTALVLGFADRTSKFQRTELVRQLKGPLGVEVQIPDKREPARVHAFTVEGVAKIQDLVARYFSQVRAVAMKALRPKHADAARADAPPPPPPDGGLSGPDSPNNFELVGSVGFDRFTLDLSGRGDAAEGIASQVADLDIRGLFAGLNQDRQRELGLDEYVWTTMEDDRVRPEHAALDGKKFPWDDPPAIGNPGEPPNCRCQAVPAVDALQDALS